MDTPGSAPAAKPSANLDKLPPEAKIPQATARTDRHEPQPPR